MRFWLAVLMLTAVLAIAPAQAQLLPNELRSAGVTQAQWEAICGEIRAQARRAEISEASLLAAAQSASVTIAGSGRFDAQNLQEIIFEALSAQADRIADLERRLEALSNEGDAAVAALFAEARTALNEGRLQDTDRLLAEAAESDLAVIGRADAEIDRRRLRAGQTIAGRGQVAFVQANYLIAADHFARAAQTLPQVAIEARWQYTMWRGEALKEQTRVFGDPEPLQQAIAAYEAALVLRPRDRAPLDWARTQLNLGIAFMLQGERGATGALARAIAAYEAALTVRTREVDAEGWALTHMNLAIALQILGERGAPGAIERAIAAYEAALSVQSRARDADAWALTQMNLAGALRVLGERGAPGALERSVAAYDAALSVITRERRPSHWAATQMSLGGALVRLGERGAPGALERAVAAYRAALQVQTRESDPIGWADTMMNLASALAIQGERGAPGALEQAVAAYEAALTVRTREADPAGWATTQTNLGTALSMLGERGAPGAMARARAAYEAALSVITRESNLDGWAAIQFNLAFVHRATGRTREARAAAQAALNAFVQIGNAHWANEARAFIARLPPN